MPLSQAVKGWEDIEDFGENRFDWLQEHGFFKLGLPVHDTIARVMSLLDSEALQRSLPVGCRLVQSLLMVRW